MKNDIINFTKFREIYSIRLNGSHIICKNGIYCSILKKLAMVTHIERPFGYLILLVSSQFIVVFIFQNNFNLFKYL